MNDKLIYLQDKPKKILMILSKKIIAGIISIAVASFVILFVIQFFLIKNTITVNRQEFSTKMAEVRRDIHECFPPGYPAIEIKNVHGRGYVLNW